MKDNVVAGLLVVACLVGIVSGLVFINSKITCVNLPLGLYTGCGITTTK